MFSWDTNASKGSFLRSVISDSMGKILKVDVNKILNFIPFNSTDPNVGIIVLKELNIWSQKRDIQNKEGMKYISKTLILG